MQVSLGISNGGAWTAGIGNAADLTPSRNFTVELNNTLNEWTGPIYVGTPKQLLSGKYDSISFVT